MIDTYDIFISYRRDGGEALACLISEKLKQKGYKVFYDVESLRSGKFNEKIFDVINTCKDVIVVLPQNGLDRCVNDDDWVRKEISYAINANKNIVPVMMRNFEFPKNMPQDIVELKNYNGVTANMELFDATFKKLNELLESSKCIDENKIKSYTNDIELQKEITDLMNEIKVNGFNPETKFQLARCFAKTGDKSLNEEIARLYSEAADAGHSKAQNNLGYCYKNGIGVERNLAKAFDLYIQSAKQGNVYAQLNLAYIFSNKKQSNELAAYWYEKAAAQDNIDAIYKMGYSYEYGIGVMADIYKAIEYYEEAAAQGNIDAIYEMGNNYEYGIGVMADFDEAIEYYERAADLGHEFAKQKLKHKLLIRFHTLFS